MKALGVEYHYLKEPIFNRAEQGELDKGGSICSYCARMKRGKLYACCREHEFNVLLLAQHLDDLAETTMMNLFHNGSLRSMGAHYQTSTGDIRVARPLIYVRESMLKKWAFDNGLPVRFL